MLKLPKPTKQDALTTGKLQKELESVTSKIEETEDFDEQTTLLSQRETLERQLDVSRSRHLLLGARTQGIEVKPIWLVNGSDSEWLTAEGRDAIESALKRRRTEDWLKVIPMFVSGLAIVVSIVSAIETSRFSQEKDFLLNRAWLAAGELTSPLSTGDLVLKVTNNGRAPALHTTVFEYAMAGNSDQSSVRSNLETACSKAATVSPNGDFVPAGSSLTIPFNATVPIPPGSSNGSSSPVLIVGCIGYEDSLDHNKHITSFGFKSAQPPPAAGSGAVAWSPYPLGYEIAN